VLFRSLLYVVACVILWRSCRTLSHRGITVALVAAGSPAFFFLVAYAQLSALALALFTAAWVALRRDRHLFAGLALGSLVYKPQLGIAVGVVFLCARDWRVIAGAIVAAAAQLGVALAYAGPAVMRSYAHTLAHLNDNIALVQEKQHLLQSLAAFFRLLVPWPAVAFAAYVIVAAVVLAAVWAFWTSGAPLELRYSLLLVATVLVSPHFYVYDLIVLTPAGFLLTNWAIEQSTIRWRTPLVVCLGLLYVAPLVGAFTARTLGVQPTVLVLTVLGISIVAAARTSKELTSGRQTLATAS